MIRVNKIILLLAIMLIANALDTPVSAKEIVVDSATEGAFNLIQEAVNDPSSGDEVPYYQGFCNKGIEIGIQNTNMDKWSIETI